MNAFKSFAIIISTAIFAVAANGQSNYNPYKEFGEEAKVLTLSKGRYVEFFDTDTLEVIGSAVLNTKTMKIIGFIEADTLYSEAILEPEIVSRFLSVDPLAAKFPFYTPYQFAGNKPVACLDLDGLEDIYFNGVLLDKQGGVVMKVVNSTEVGKQAHEEFKDTKANVGYDLYIFEGNTQGKYGKAGGTTIAAQKGSFTYKDYEKYVDYFGVESLPFKDKIKESFEKKRGVIFVKLPEGTFDQAEKDVAEGKFESTEEAVLSYLHELIAHAVPMSQEKDKGNAGDHGIYFFDPIKKQTYEAENSPSKLKIKAEFPNSKAGKVVRQVEQDITNLKKSFNSKKGENAVFEK